jgi:hypothetical protein
MASTPPFNSASFERRLPDEDDSVNYDDGLIDELDEEGPMYDEDFSESDKGEQSDEDYAHDFFVPPESPVFAKAVNQSPSRQQGNSSELVLPSSYIRPMSAPINQAQAQQLDAQTPKKHAPLDIQHFVPVGLPPRHAAYKPSGMAASASSSALPAATAIDSSTAENKKRPVIAPLKLSGVLNSFSPIGSASKSWRPVQSQSPIPRCGTFF